MIYFRPTVAGIHPGPEGAYSIALSGGYEDDIDLGECFTYTGEGMLLYTEVVIASVTFQTVSSFYNDSLMPIISNLYNCTTTAVSACLFF